MIWLSSRSAGWQRQNAANWNLRALCSFRYIATVNEWRAIVAKAGILWLLGVPVVVIILLAVFTNVI
jgi:hypothetical protein